MGQGGGMPMGAPGMGAPPMGGGMPMGGGGGGTMPGCAPDGTPLYPEQPQMDINSLMQQMPGLTLPMLLQMIAQTSQPMEEAQEGRGAMQGGPNPLLAALMQMGAAP